MHFHKDSIRAKQSETKLKCILEIFPSGFLLWSAIPKIVLLSLSYQLWPSSLGPLPKLIFSLKSIVNKASPIFKFSDWCWYSPFIFWLASLWRIIIFFFSFNFFFVFSEKKELFCSNFSSLCPISHNWQSPSLCFVFVYSFLKYSFHILRKQERDSGLGHR